MEVEAMEVEAMELEVMELEVTGLEVMEGAMEPMVVQVDIIWDNILIITAMVVQATWAIHDKCRYMMSTASESIPSIITSALLKTCEYSQYLT
jgi:hypothetical protein